METDIKKIVFSVIARRSGLEIADIFSDSRLVQDLHLDGDDAVDTLIEIAQLTNLNLDGFSASAYFNPEPNLFSFFNFGKLQKRELTVSQIIVSATTGVPLGGLL